MRPPVGFGPVTARKLLGLLDQKPAAKEAVERGREISVDVYFVQITSTTKIAGRYSGTWYSYDAVTKVKTAEDAVWVVDMNNRLLVTNTFYPAFRSGYADDRAVWLTALPLLAAVPGTITSGNRESDLTTHAMTCTGAGTFRPSVYGTGAMSLASKTCAGVGRRWPPPGGGSCLAGAMTCAGVGTSAKPVRTGTSAKSFGSMSCSGAGHTSACVCKGSMAKSIGPMSCSGAGIRTVPVRTGSGGLTLGAMILTGSGSTGIPATSPGNFTALISGPQFISSRWRYDWIEQSMNSSTGDYENKSGGRSGTAAGGRMREVNNHLVAVPTFVHVRQRGVLLGSPLYDFDRCCTVIPLGYIGTMAKSFGAMTMSGSGTFVPKFTGGGSLLLGAMTMTGSGTFVPKFTGGGSLLLGAMTMSGSGTFVPKFTGGGSLLLGAMTMTGSGTMAAGGTYIGTIASGSNSLNLSGPGLPPYPGVDIGDTVTGPGLPGGTIVTGISGSTITLSNNSTSFEMGQTYVFS